MTVFNEVRNGPRKDPGQIQGRGTGRGRGRGRGNGMCKDPGVTDSARSQETVKGQDGWTTWSLLGPHGVLRLMESYWRALSHAI